METIEKTVRSKEEFVAVLKNIIDGIDDYFWNKRVIITLVRRNNAVTTWELDTRIPRMAKKQLKLMIKRMYRVKKEDFIS